MPYFLGIDGGQSSTTALVGDETGRVLGFGIAGPCNHVGVADGPEKLARVVRSCASDACKAAGLRLEQVQFQAACFGMSGGPADKEAILASVIAADHMFVTHDAMIALAGAVPDGVGALVIAGTGSIAFARNTAGRTARAGGWGYVFGDEGGAFDIVRQAVRAVLRLEEGWGPQTALREMLLTATGVANANALVHLFYTDDWPRSRVARLSPTVDEAARLGDCVACAILAEAGRQLSELEAKVTEQLWMPGEDVFAAWVGGVFRSDKVRSVFEREWTRAAGHRCGPPLYPPAAGALLEALRSAGQRRELRGLPSEIR